MLKFDGIDESIITKKDNAILALRSLEKEMDSRYDLLANEGKRNIAEYNGDMKNAAMARHLGTVSLTLGYTRKVL